MGEKKELMDFSIHQASLSQVRGVNSGQVNDGDPQRTPVCAPLDACSKEYSHSQGRTIG